AYYGGWPNIKEKDCYLTSSYYGFMDGATCEGETWYAGFVRNGYAGLVCDSGEVRIGTGCVTKPPFVKCPTCKPQNPGPQASTNVGNPIDTRSGLKTEYALDFSTAGADPLKFERYYVSDTGNVFGRIGPGRLGKGWRSNFDVSIDYTGNPSSGAWMYHIQLPNGSQLMFEYDTQKYFNWSSQWWVAGALDGSARIVWNYAAARYEVTTEDDTVWSFDYGGYLRTITYRGGYTQQLSYDANGNNTLVQDSFGRQLTFTYTAQGLLASMTVPGGQTYLYNYATRYEGDDA